MLKMSSALKPVLTPAGAQNPPVPSQLNKPMHPQGAPNTYGQPMSHMPQNLVNIPHNPSSSAPTHATTHNMPHHINTNTHSSSHSTNHYSISVPNASQHYPVSGSVPVTAHSAPVSNHPIPNPSQSHAQPMPFNSPPKNLSFNPSFQANLGHSYKPTNAPQNAPPVQPQPAAAAQEEPSERPQSNGTAEVKTVKAQSAQQLCTLKPEASQNRVPTASIKDKPPPPQQPAPSPAPASPEKAKIPEKAEVTPPEQPKPEVDGSKAEVTTSSPEKSSVGSSSSSPAASHASSDLNSVTSTTSTSVAESSTVATTASPTSSVTTTSVQQVVTSSTPENKESQASSGASVAINNKPREPVNQKSTLKLATTPRMPMRKAKPKAETLESPKSAKSDPKTPTQKSPPGGKIKRTRTRTQPYQSPLPEVEMISKISATTPKTKNSEDKLIIFYKNEFLAVRNSEGGFYVCQAVQNIYKSSPRIRIRWLSQDKSEKEIYTPDFYDYTDFDCILTNLHLTRVDKGKFKLPNNEKIRTDSILKRALAVEKGDATPPSLTEEHPDGLDLSLYKEESQLKKRKRAKRRASSPLKSSRSSSVKKSPDQSKVRKVASKVKSAPTKKSTALKKTLAPKAKKVDTGRAERAAKRSKPEPPKSPAKTSPVIDQKKARVLAKVARKAPPPPPKAQPPPKQSAKNIKQAAATKKPTALSKKEKKEVVTRKSKRGKK